MLDSMSMGAECFALNKHYLAKEIQAISSTLVWLEVDICSSKKLRKLSDFRIQIIFRVLITANIRLMWYFLVLMDDGADRMKRLPKHSHSLITFGKTNPINFRSIRVCNISIIVV